MKSDKEVLKIEDCLAQKAVVFKLKNDPGGFFISINGKKNIYPVGEPSFPTVSEMIVLSFRKDFKQLVDTGVEYEII